MVTEKFKIVVVDDSKIMRRIITSLLNKIGYYDVREAAGGYSALEILKTETVAAVFSDYSMPGMTGIELLRTIRSDVQNDDIRFIMVTAEAQLGQIIAAFREGAQHYITKPFTAEYMQYIVKLVLQGR